MKNSNSRLTLLRFAEELKGTFLVQASYGGALFGPDDWLEGFDTADPNEVERIVRFMFNIKPHCFTYLRHPKVNDYFWAREPHKFRSAGFKCAGCGATVRRAKIGGREAWDCHCALAVMGKGTSDFTASEWRKYRLQAIEREIPLRARLAGDNN